MKVLPVLFVGIFVALLVGEIIYELGSGKLLARGWKVYTRRQDNPMLYWSSIVLQMFVALFLLGMFFVVFFGVRVERTVTIN
jgi:hypothetical protein